ncbi:MAG: phage tail family protein [Defluviitaleaceae bacterium]|nr:phage tail family protein [Defluviitaleaceae bacterium]
MVGFFFADKHSRDFDIVVMEVAHRGLLPPKRRNDYEISGRHGTVDFGGETFATRQISVEICFISRDEEQLQELARDIAFWLSGKGLLFFDDEPHRAYNAVVYQSVDTEQIITAKRATVIFECQPFAKTIHQIQSNNPNIASGTMIPIYSHGTQSTPCLIVLQNTGNTNITNIRFTRRATRR